MEHRASRIFQKTGLYGLLPSWRVNLDFLKFKSYFPTSSFQLGNPGWGQVMRVTEILESRGVVTRTADGLSSFPSNCCSWCSTIGMIAGTARNARSWNICTMARVCVIVFGAACENLKIMLIFFFWIYQWIPSDLFGNGRTWKNLVFPNQNNLRISTLSSRMKLVFHFQES